MAKMLKRWWPLFVLPTALSFLFGFMIPFVQGFYLSFCKFITISDAKPVGLDNYVAAFSDHSLLMLLVHRIICACLNSSY